MTIYTSDEIRHMRQQAADAPDLRPRVHELLDEVLRLTATVERVGALAEKWEGDRLNTVIDKEAAAYAIRDALKADA